MSSILFFCVSFFASIAGAICGIGGGVIIKPGLDMLEERTGIPVLGVIPSVFFQGAPCFP